MSMTEKLVVGAELLHRRDKMSTQKTMYAIRRTCHFYGPVVLKSYVLDELAGRFGEQVKLLFASKKEAEKEVERLDAQEYRLSHNESGRADYVVIRTTQEI